MFKLKEYNTDAKTEILAGITTFLTMIYIVIVNPVILSSAGVPFDQVFTATIISAVVATLWMALAANYPIAIAPGMGMNPQAQPFASTNPGLAAEGRGISDQDRAAAQFEAQQNHMDQS